VRPAALSWAPGNDKKVYDALAELCSIAFFFDAREDPFAREFFCEGRKMWDWQPRAKFPMFNNSRTCIAVVRKCLFTLSSRPRLWLLHLPGVVGANLFTKSIVNGNSNPQASHTRKFSSYTPCEISSMRHAMTKRKNRFAKSRKSSLYVTTSSAFSMYLNHKFKTFSSNTSSVPYIESFNCENCSWTVRETR
jgi:hypothetical protein